MCKCAHHNLGDYQQATACYEHALAVLRDVGDRYYEALSLTHLGDTHEAAGDLTAARDAWRHAVSALDDLRHSDVDIVRAKLQHLDRDQGQ